MSTLHEHASVSEIEAVRVVVALARYLLSPRSAPSVQLNFGSGMVVERQSSAGLSGIYGERGGLELLASVQSRVEGVSAYLHNSKSKTCEVAGAEVGRFGWE
jgi:hypothetical protein